MLESWQQRLAKLSNRQWMRVCPERSHQLGLGRFLEADESRGPLPVRFPLRGFHPKQSIQDQMGAPADQRYVGISEQLECVRTSV